MIDLQSISSNLLLVGFALVSICCLYLLYSNFTKVREIEDLKHKVEDLKNIFFNQQKHNDETYSNIMNILVEKDLHVNHQPSELSSNTTQQKEINNTTSTKIINIDLKKSSELNLENLEFNNSLTNKSININLLELDDMDDLDDDLDEELNNDLVDELNDDLNDSSKLNIEDSINIKDIPIIEDNIFDIIDLNKNINNEICDDAISITTDPMISDLDLNEIMEGNHNKDENENENEDGDKNDNDIEDNNEDDEDDNKDEDNELDDLDLDLDNLEVDLDINNESNLNKSKQVNIDNFASLSDTIINQSTMDVESNNDIKNIKMDLEIETIELDKLLSGEIKKVEIIHKNEDLNTMSIKQLKELAKANNIKISGNKKDLITALSDIKQ